MPNGGHNVLPEDLGTYRKSEVAQVLASHAELLAACVELMPILREPLHWRLLVPGERKLILRIEAAIAKTKPPTQPGEDIAKAIEEEGDVR